MKGLVLMDGHHKITGIPAIYAWNGASNGASGLGYAS